MEKSYDQINEKIRQGKAVVLTAAEMKLFIKENGVKKAAEKVDVVTTGTFGAMCSSGAILNLGHDDPPIKMEKILLNGVSAYGGIAAVDTYIGATQASDNYGYNYGGAHVIEDLVNKKEISLYASGKPTGCYPGSQIKSSFTIDDINEALLLNPRNAYQRYNAAANSTKETLFTYMGKLLPECENITFSGAGEISPINNDPDFETIGIGTRIFLGGAQGYIINHGTQHNPGSGFSTLMVMGNLKEMSSEFLRAAVMEKYGCTLFVGIGVPIPILNERIAEKTGIRDEEILTDIIDYGVPSRSRPAIKTKVSYSELKSGFVELNGKKIKSASISSLYYAKIITEKLKEMILSGSFALAKPVQKLPIDCKVKPHTRKEFFEYRLPDKNKYDLVTYESARCTKCELCISLCPFEAIKMSKENDIMIDYELCTDCGSCLEFCPMRCFKI